MKKTTATVLFFLCTAILWGQSSVQQPQIIPPSPQAQLFQKYLNHQITEYNGLPEINIPLYEVKVKGLTIPITLSYHAGGIRYKQYDGEVGAGWSINAGGYRVSRSINGRDDFYYEKYDRDEFDYYFTNIGSGYELDAYLSSMVVWREEYDRSEWINPWKLNIDGEYDRFSYILPSSNGQFLISQGNNSGSAIQTVKIEDNLDKLNKVARNETHIIDGNGFNYYFGGKQDNTDLHELISGEGVGSPTSWPLRQIVSPFNDIINFRYEKFSQGQSHRGRTSSIVEPWMVTTPATRAENSEFSTSRVAPSESAFRYEDMFYIQKIETDDIIVEFKRNGRNPSIEILPPYQLIKEIVVTNRQNNEILRRFVLNYKNVPITLSDGSLGGYAHHLLESVTIHSRSQSEQKYNLEYYGPDSMTSIQSNRLYADQWGFYKDKGSEAYEPFLHKEFENDKYVYTGGSKPPVLSVGQLFYSRLLDRSANDQSVIHYFSLKKLTYPTGGYSEYEYEPHKFPNPSVIVSGGGQRIKKIKSVGADSEAVTTIFKYGENENGTGIANIHFSKDLFANETYYIQYSSPYYLQKIARNYSNKPLGEIDNSMFQVNYPQVTTYQVREADGITNGKTVSRYNIYRQYTIDYMDGISLPSGTYTIINNGYSKGIKTYHSGYKPLLANRSFYNNDDIKIREEQYEYIPAYKSNDPEAFYGIRLIRKVYFETYHNVGNSPYDYITSAYDLMEYAILRDSGRLLSRKTTTNYSPAGTHPTTAAEQYQYNTRNQLTLKIMEKSIGGEDDLFEEYTYPSSDTELARRNMLSTIIGEKKIETYNGSTIYNEYYNYPSNAILPDYVTFGRTPRIELTYDKYDEKGNLLQYTRLDGTPVSCIWSYNYHYPIAEIIGATYSQVSTALNMNMTTLASNKNPDQATINTIKSLGTKLSNAFVTVYTYKPLVGILTATDPSGITTYYEYDSFDRLKRIYVKEGTTEKNIQTFNYNYQNQ
ncbi:hypothetical protein [Bacteroides sp. UBA939]|uniref:hypothetical protein n=1 Tax=Bacteroides sp. UBA939 TaxID=1946092 RepID=UPI0025C5B9EE|nr:hypothetical protein [Bacteroides sp. UBA939]